MNKSQGGWIGASLPRKEDRTILRGKAKYFADILLPNQTHLMFLRSPHAHAKIVSIDVSSAKRMPGVIEVVTGDDLRREVLSLPQPSTQTGLPGKNPEFWPLAVEKVKFHGEPIAAVLAESPYAAEDALEEIFVDYDVLPYVGDMEAALLPDSPLVHDQWRSNESFSSDYAGGRSEEEHRRHVEEANRRIRDASYVVRERFRAHRCGVTALEPRGALATWDESDGLTAWITTQRPHIERIVLAEVLQLPTSRVRVIAPKNQGGGFGMKAPIYREPLLVSYLAKKMGRPVRWLETREENLMTVGQERDQIHDMEIAADDDGVILALKDRGIADGGDGCAGLYWGYVMPMAAGARLPSAYDIPFCDITMRVAATNKAVLTPARGFGVYPVRFAIERAVDILARSMKIEPHVLRRKNLIRQLPATTSTGVIYESGDFLKTYDRLIELIDVPKFRREQAEARSKGRYIGLGVSCAVEPAGADTTRYLNQSGTPGYAAIDLRVDPHGHIIVMHGDAPHGQGQETTISQIVAQELGVDPDNVTVIYGDTLMTPYTTGTVASRGASIVLPAVLLACRNVREKIVRVLCHDAGIEGSDSDFLFEDGKIRHIGSNNITRSFSEIAHRIVVRAVDLPPGDTGTLETKVVFEPESGKCFFGAHAAIVEVNVETGDVSILRYVSCEDAGVVINPAIVRGQVEGGVVQGISNFFFEQYVYDANGQQLTSTLENYKIATAPDVPRIETYHDAGTRCVSNPLGARAVGEGCIGPVPGALGNAISDALSPFGIEILEMPVRPSTLLPMIRRAEARSSAALA